jgi:polyisoprenoid-binding protein YceI
VLDGAGGVVAERSRFTIDLASLESDSDRRDNFVRRNTLQTEAHPAAIFVPTGFRGVEFPLPEAGEITFQLVGDLTVRDVTRPATWDVTASVEGGVVAGTARTGFTFDDFELQKPRVASVLSVADDIRLEYDFRLVRRD